MDESLAVASLAALAQGMRLRIFRALVGAAPEGMTPGMLSAMLDLPASTLSFHLKELLHSGLVAQVREGRNLIYQPRIAQMSALLDYLAAHCCQGAVGDVRAPTANAAANAAANSAARTPSAACAPGTGCQPATRRTRAAGAHEPTSRNEPQASQPCC